MTEKELFISWLNDAYSTELAMMPVLENHAKDARDYPQIQERKLQHLEETKRQAERLETMIVSLGGKISTVKSLTGKTLGLGKSVSTEIFSDELIKNFIADYAAEHFEIASYTSLIATAKHVGENQCVPVLEEILAEEIAMAEWIKDHIPMATVESIKIAAGNEDSESSKKSNGKKRIGARILSPTGLVTALGVGAIGAGAAMILRSSQSTGKSNQNTLDVGTGNDINSNAGSDTPRLEQTNVVITETLIVEDEPELVITRVSEGDTL